MLKFMRRHAKFFYIFFFIVIISFVFFYVGPIDKSQNLIVAKIDNEKIYMDEYWNAYENLRDYYTRTIKTKFDEELDKRLKKEALQRLIDERILMRLSKELNIDVSDEELAMAIINNPLFMKNGVFDKDHYMRILRSNRLTPEMYESSLRRSLMMMKLKRLIEGTVELKEIPQISSGNPEIEKALREAILFEEKDRILRAYINGIKKYMKIEITDQGLKS